LNEGDPASNLHYALADEFGKYMHCRVFGIDVGDGDGETCLYDHPNRHMVSTSNWHSFPKYAFWRTGSPYPNVDFADIHQYIPESDSANHSDAALASQSLSISNMLAGTGKPIIRGETGFTKSGSGPESDEIKQDTDGIWLHNLIWAGINPGGLIESYWYENEHIYNGAVDFRPHYKTYFNFVEDIPLNNGYYQDAAAQVIVTKGDSGDIRAWGQKDLTHSCAHLWIQNKNHTWQNVVDGMSIPAVTGTIQLSGFQPNASYTLQWWNPYEPDKTSQIFKTATVVSQSDGSVAFLVKVLITDTAIQLISANGCMMEN
jgi:hypothetical protein